jgi:hypothetical protein
MYDPISNKRAQARTSNLSEELGQVRIPSPVLFD